jgi:hypothetical protein
MWIQIIKARLKSGKDAELAGLMKELQAIEQPGSGLVRTIVTREQQDPSALQMIIVFESEAKARAREQDEQRQDNLGPARQTMAEIFEGPPEFVDLEVIEEYTPA